MPPDATLAQTDTVPREVAARWTVFVFASMGYDRIHARKHALVETCVRLGFEAVYVEPPSSTHPRRTGTGALTLNAGGLTFKVPTTPARVGPHHSVLTVPKKLRVGPVRMSMGRRTNERLQAAWLKQFFATYRTTHPGRRLLAVVANARWEALVRDIAFDLLVVDKTDVPETLAGWLTTAEYLERERALLARCALVMAASPALETAASTQHPPVRTLFVSNGVDLAHFDAHANDPVPELADLPRPFAGFLGTVAHWIDFPLLGACARAHPDWSFPLFGPVNRGLDLSPVDGLPNVRFFGHVPYARVPAIMNQFDIGLMPFLPLGAVNPVTMYEFLTTGRPLVITPSEDYAHLRDLVYMSEAGFLADVDRAMADDDPALRDRRRAAARRYGWDGLFGRALATLPLADPVKT